MRIRTLLTQPKALVNRRAGFDLFLLSAFILYLAQVSLRWFPEQVLQLGRFPNVVLLACFLGTALGCLAAGRALRFITWTPLCLSLAVVLATDAVVEWVNQHDLPAREVFTGIFFVLIALTLAGPGQELGRALDRVPNQLLGITLIVLGGAAGLLLFAACTYYELGPWWWFLAIVLTLTYFGRLRSVAGSLFGYWARPANLMILAGTFGLIAWTSFPFALRSVLPTKVSLWSPYARFEYEPRRGPIAVYQVDRQVRIAADERRDPEKSYDLPFLLNRDAGGHPFRRVLVIGAGVGNEINLVLQWNAEHVDAVEIDPIILRLGSAGNSTKPCQDPRVHVYLSDGRSFLRSCNREYDLILYSLGDAPLPPAGFDDFRRVSYLVTRQAFGDIHRCLSPHGIFVLGSRIRETWFSVRLRQSLEEVFPEAPLLLTYSFMPRLAAYPADSLALFLAGNTGPIRQALRENPAYLLWQGHLSDPDQSNGFTQLAGDSRPHVQDYIRPVPVAAAEYLDTPEDDWPFLFLRRRMIPDWVNRDLVLLTILSVVLLWAFRPASAFPRLDEGQPASLARLAGGWPPFRLEMFFLGTGFMLAAITTRVDATLLFGDTWMMDPIAGLTIQVLILSGLGLVLTLRPVRLWPSYASLLLALLLHRLVPLDSFLGHDQAVSAVGSYLLGLAPVLFAGMIFILLFRRSPEPARDLGAVLAGAVLGGMAGNLALVWGFRSLILLAAGSFAVAAVPSARRALREYDRRHPFARVPVRTRVGARRLSHFGKR